MNFEDHVSWLLVIEASSESLRGRIVSGDIELASDCRD
jgi:hypothetical protein